MAMRKHTFEKSLGNTEMDFFKYCLCQLYYQQPITKRKLLNHFSENLINDAENKKVIVPWKDGYYFRAADYAKQIINIKGEIDEQQRKNSIQKN